MPTIQKQILSSVFLSKKENRSDCKESRRFYNSTAWRKLRNKIINDQPLCRICEHVGKLTAATCIDHIKPIRLGGQKLNTNNLQPLCDSCHAKKSQKEGQHNPSHGTTRTT